jgi:hypothetical protein
MNLVTHLQETPKIRLSGVVTPSRLGHKNFTLLDATEVFIADLIACSTCFGHHYAHHQELGVLYGGCCLWYFVLWFSSCWSGVELRVMFPVCRTLLHPNDGHSGARNMLTKQ